MIAILAIGLAGTAVGCLAGALLDRWVRTRHPDHWTHITGLPLQRVEQLAETRRRAGTDPWRTR